MGDTQEKCLQNLLEEERVLNSALKQVRSKYLQLQVEQMGLKNAHAKLLTKCNLQSFEVATPLVNELSESRVSQVTNPISLSQFSNPTSEELNEIANNQAKPDALDTGGIDDIMTELELAVTEGLCESPDHSSLHCETMEVGSEDELLTAVDLDDPSVVNKKELNTQVMPFESESEDSS